jgi:hypothetical protein
MKRLIWLVLLFCLPPIVGIGLHAQNKTVKIRQEKALTGANEFIITIEGGDYNTLRLQVEEILDNEPMVVRHVFFSQLQRISAIVKDPWTFANLKAIFEANGFVVFDKGNARNPSVEHN